MDECPVTCVLRYRSNDKMSLTCLTGSERISDEILKQGSDIGAFCDTIKCLSCHV